MFDKKYKLMYTRVAFRTDKGTFTLSATEGDYVDTFKCLETGLFHTWNRRQVRDWFEKGKIKPVEEANCIECHLDTTQKIN